MAAALIAVVVALLLGHLAPQLAVVRRFEWFDRWLGALGGGRFASPYVAVLLAVLVPTIVVLLVQGALDGVAYGLPAFVFALAVVFYCWGPRDLDRDVDAVVDAGDVSGCRAAAERLTGKPQPVIDGGRLVAATFDGALSRWFGVLLWFVVLGPAGAVLFRLAHRAADAAPRDALSPAEAEVAIRLRTLLDWPVAQLMVFGLALVGHFDVVLRTWRDWHRARGGWFVLDNGYLAAAGRASVDCELVDDDIIAAADIDHPPPLLELRDAMSMIWRLLILWLAVVALFVLAGYVG